MNIIISTTAGTPIYEQIAEQIKAAIFSGEVREGDLLPSIRGLSRDLKISVITTMRAYSDLEKAGLVVTIQGKGCYVRPQAPSQLQTRKLDETRRQLAAVVKAARRAGVSGEELTGLLKDLVEGQEEV